MGRLSREQRIALAESYLEKGSIIQGEWRDRRLGRQMVCALAAFGPDINDSRHCPADLMPGWMAELVPVIDDGISFEEVHCYAGGLIARARKWDKLDSKAWTRIQKKFIGVMATHGAPPSHLGVDDRLITTVTAVSGVSSDTNFATHNPKRQAAYKHFGQKLFALIDEELAAVE